MSEAENLDLLEQALALEPAKRLALATKLLDSVEEPDEAGWSDAWAQEIDRRIAAIEDGSDPGETWEQVRKIALAGLSRR